MSSGICHNYSTAVEAAIHCWFSMHLWALPSLWASLSAATMWLWMVWASIFCCREVQGHQESLENAKSMLQLCPFPGHAEASQDEWGKTQVVWSHHSQGGESEPGPSGSFCPGSATQTPTSTAFWRAVSWRSSWWATTWPTSAGWWPPGLGWVSLSPKGSPSRLTRSLQRPEASEEPLWHQGFCCWSPSLQPQAAFTLELSSMT